MRFYFILSFICYLYQSTFTKIKLELKKNISNYGYGINYKYEGMLAHSCDRFYRVTKFILPCVEDINFSELSYDNMCTYLDSKHTHGTDTRKHMLDFMSFCKKIEPFVVYYKRLIKSYNHMTHNILQNEINLILPQISKKQKCGFITMVVSSFISLAYEGISSLLHLKRNKALHKLSKLCIVKPANIQYNKLMQLENPMLMYSVYYAETLEKLINTVNDIHNTTSSHERLFVGQQSSLTLRSLYTHALGLYHYSLNSLLYLRIIHDKYVPLYRELITQLQIYATAIRILSKGYLHNTLVAPLKLQEILNEVRSALRITNPNYDLVIDRLHLYYDMQLVTFGIDNDKYLIVQFLVFIQPYMQQLLTTNIISVGNSASSNN